MDPQMALDSVASNNLSLSENHVFYCFIAREGSLTVNMQSYPYLSNSKLGPGRMVLPHWKFLLTVLIIYILYSFGWNCADNFGYGLRQCETTFHCNVVFIGWAHTQNDPCSTVNNRDNRACHIGGNYWSLQLKTGYRRFNRRRFLVTEHIPRMIPVVPQITDTIGHVILVAIAGQYN